MTKENTAAVVGQAENTAPQSSSISALLAERRAWNKENRTSEKSEDHVFEVLAFDQDRREGKEHRVWLQCKDSDNNFSVNAKVIPQKLRDYVESAGAVAVKATFVEWTPEGESPVLVCRKLSFANPSLAAAMTAGFSLDLSNI